jgi:hypothetical protein
MPTSPRSKKNPYHPIFKITDETRQDLSPKEIVSLLDSYKSQLSSLKLLISSMADCLIAQVSLSSMKALETVRKIEETLTEQIKTFTETSTLTKKTFFYLSKSLLQLPSLDSHISRAVSQISETFTFDFLEKFPIPNEIHKDFIFYFTTKGPTFHKIDIDSLQCLKSDSTTTFPCVFSSGCELNNGIFFLHGGSKHFEASSETCIYDIYLNKIEKLPNSNFSRNGSTCIKKDEKIFIFGSSNPISRNCERFDLSDFSWKKIGNLPKEAAFPSGSLISGKILLTGVGLNGFWVFDENNENYELIEFEVSGGYKAICQEFLASNEGLFEIRKERSQWKVDKYPINWISNPLAISLSFRRKGKIYFIDSHLKLFCIDPSSKSLVELRYE